MIEDAWSLLWPVHTGVLPCTYMCVSPHTQLRLQGALLELSYDKAATLHGSSTLSDQPVLSARSVESRSSEVGSWPGAAGQTVLDSGPSSRAVSS